MQGQLPEVVGSDSGRGATGPNVIERWAKKRLKVVGKRLRVEKYRSASSDTFSGPSR